MISILKGSYRSVYSFPQMHGDYKYFKKVNASGVELIGQDLSAYDQFLKNEETDYVGSRLHGSLRVLQFKKRTVVISTDHRSP